MIKMLINALNNNKESFISPFSKSAPKKTKMLICTANPKVDNTVNFQKLIFVNPAVKLTTSFGNNGETLAKNKAHSFFCLKNRLKWTTSFFSKIFSAIIFPYLLEIKNISDEPKNAPIKL